MDLQIYTSQQLEAQRRDIKSNSLKSLKVVARFFSYVRTGYKACVPGEGFGKNIQSHYHPYYKKVTKTGMGILCVLPLVVLYDPPVTVGAVNQGILLVFLKRQVIVSELCVVLQSDDHPLS